MSVKISPRDRVVVTNFRHSPGNSISMFSLKEVDATPADIAVGDFLQWDGSKFVVANTITANIEGGTYDQTGSLGGSTLTLRYSEVAEKPQDGSLSQGELAYSFLPDNWDGLQWDGGQTLYVGDADGNPVAIGSKRIYDYSNHLDGQTVANSFLIVGDDKNVDELKIGEIRLSGSTLSVENAGSNLYLSPGGLGNISATGHRIINLLDPVDDQDAVTKKYVDDAIANFEIAPVVIATSAPANPDDGDLWYDSQDTFRLYVWNDETNSWVDASPNVNSSTGLVTISTTSPANPEVGQAWYDSDDTGRTYVWDGIQWVDMSPSNLPETSHVTVADAAPASPKSGDLWYDSSDTYRLYVWDDISSGWIDASPSTGGDDEHVIIAVDPPVSPNKGDLWYDSDPTSSTSGRTFVWDGAQWVDIAPNNLAEASSLIVIQSYPPTNPDIGTAWYDMDDTGRTYVWDGTQWVDIAPTDVSSGGTSNTIIAVSPVAPTNPHIGMPWYDPNTTTGYIWDGTDWIVFSNPDDGTPHVQIGLNAPTAPNDGDLWYDSASTFRLYVWDDATTSWIDASPAISENIALINVANDPPTDPEIGSAWYDLDNTGRTFVWDGTQWVDIAPAGEMPTTADAAVYIAANAPLDPFVGQYWFNDQTKKGYVWNGGYWDLISDPHSGRPHSEIGNTAPTAAEYGDIWVDTNNQIVNYYDGSNWISYNQTVGYSNNLIIIDSNPPITPDVGTAWYDEDNTGRTFVWDGAQWVDIAPPTTGTDEWELIEINTAIAGGAIYTSNVASLYKKVVITLDDVELDPVFSSVGGVTINVTTSTSNTYEVFSESVATSDYPFNRRTEFDTYQNGGLFMPTTYLLNKYKEIISSVTLKTSYNGDKFTKGTLRIWGLK